MPTIGANSTVRDNPAHCQDRLQEMLCGAKGEGAPTHLPTTSEAARGVEPPCLRSVSMIREQENLLAPKAFQPYLTIVLPCGHQTVTSAAKLMTSVSTKGQVILPKSIRQRRRWDVGTRLIVEDTPDGVLLKAVPVFKLTQSDDVFGSLKVGGPPKTLEEMDAGVAAEARRRHARD